MTPGARFEAVIQLYDMIAAAAKPADQILHDYMRQRKFIGSKDRKFIADHVFALLRHEARLKWWVNRLDLKNSGRSLVLAYLAGAQGKNLGDIAAVFDGQGYGPPTLTAREKDLMITLQKSPFTPSDMDERTQTECPPWAYPGLKKAYGDRLAFEMTALQEEAPLDFRVNTLKNTRETVLKKLLSDGIQATPTPFSPLGIRVIGRPAFSAHPLYQDGSIEVQDEGSQLLSLLCGVKPGEWVVDFCAGAGGKTLALAAQLKNKGRLWACDVEAIRLENARKRLRRAGVHCAELHALNSEDDPWVKRHAGKADAVLIDAPCSGVGTWRRTPYARWQKLGPSLKSLTALQPLILDSAARLVKSGGRLIYATCSMLPEENQEQVDRFLKDNPRFKPVPLERMWLAGDYQIPPDLDLTLSSLQLSPARHQTDGFFVSAMMRD